MFQRAALLANDRSMLNWLQISIFRIDHFN